MLRSCKRLLALLMTLVMLFSVSPAASAAGSTFFVGLLYGAGRSLTEGDSSAQGTGDVSLQGPDTGNTEENTGESVEDTDTVLPEGDTSSPGGGAIETPEGEQPEEPEGPVQPAPPEGSEDENSPEEGPLPEEPGTPSPAPGEDGSEGETPDGEDPSAPPTEGEENQKPDQGEVPLPDQEGEDGQLPSEPAPEEGQPPAPETGEQPPVLPPVPPVPPVSSTPLIPLLPSTPIQPVLPPVDTTGWITLGDQVLKEGDTISTTASLAWNQRFLLGSEPITVEIPEGLLTPSVGTCTVEETGETFTVERHGERSFVIPAWPQVRGQNTSVVVKFSAVTGLDPKHLNGSRDAITIGNLALKVKDDGVVEQLPGFKPGLYLKPYDEKNPEANKVQNNAKIQLADKFYYVIRKEKLQGNHNPAEDIKENIPYRIPLPAPLVSSDPLVDEKITIKVERNGFLEDLEFARVSANRGDNYLTIVFNVPSNEEHITLGLIENIYLSFTCQIDRNQAQADEQGRITIQIDDSTTITLVVDELKPKPPEPPKLTKSSNGMNSNGVTTWSITYTPPEGKYTGERPTKLVDQLPEHLVYIAENATPGLTYDQTTHTLTYELPAEEQPVTLTYRTRIDHTKIYEFWGSGQKATFRNQVKALNASGVQVTVDGVALQAESQVDTKNLIPLLKKSYKQVKFDEKLNSYVIDWEIAVSPMAVSFSNFQLVDHYGDALTPVKENPVRIAQNGQSAVVDASRYTIDSSAYQISMDVSQISDLPQWDPKSPYQIYITTQVDGTYLEYTHQEAKVHLKNEVYATFTPEDKLGEPIRSTTATGEPPNLSYVLLSKRGVKYDAEDQSVTWEVEINPKRENGVNPYLETAFFEDETRYVSDDLNNAQSFGVTEELRQAQVTSILEQLKKAGVVDPEVTIQDMGDGKQKLTVQLKETGKNPITFQFKTYILHPGIWGGNISSAFSVPNTAMLKREGTIIRTDHDTHPIQVDVKATNNWTFRNQIVLSKAHAGFDPFTHELTWKLKLNQRDAKLGTIWVEDTLPKGLTYVAGSAKLDGVALEEYHRTMPPFPSAEEKDYGIYVPGEGEQTDKIHFHLTNVVDPHELEFKTKVDLNLLLETRSLKFDNNAALYLSMEGKWLRTGHHQNTAFIEQEVLKKTVDKKNHAPIYNHPQGGKAVNYVVEVNPLSLPLLKEEWDELTLEDQLDHGLILDTDTVKLYEGITKVQLVQGKYQPVVTKGALIEDNYFEYDNIANRLSVYIPDANKSYVLEYSTFVTSIGVDLSNRIWLEGSRIQDTQISSSNTKVHLAAGGGGTIRPPANKIASIGVKKVNEQGRPIAGATVGIYAEQRDDTLLGVGVSGSDGQCLITIQGSQLPKDYETLYYKEIEAPPGYLMDHDFYPITKEEVANQTVKTLTNKAVKPGSNGVLEVLKWDEAKRPLAGAEFGLYQSKEEAEQGKNIVQTRVSDYFGRAMFDGLATGTYYVKELKAPKGFVGTQEIYSVDVKTDATTTLHVTNQFELVNLTVKALDQSTGAPLADTVFELYEANEEEAKDKQTTDHEGQATFENLKPQVSYTLKEETPPGGYHSNPTTFQITPGIGEEVKQEVPYTTRPVDLTVTLKDEITEQPLKGGDFYLTSDPEGGNLVGERKTTDDKGQCVFEKLLPEHEYYLWEEKAPENYKRPLRPWPIKIGTDEKQEETVHNTKFQVILQVGLFDEKGRRPLEDVSFQLTSDPAGKHPIGPKQATDEDGHLYFVKLEQNTDYYLWEDEPLHGYYPAKSPIKISIGDSTTMQQSGGFLIATQTVIAQRLPVTLTVYRENDKGNPIPQTEFRLTTDLEGEDDLEGVPDPNRVGVVQFEGLSQNKSYYLWEDKTPPGYEPITSPVKIQTTYAGNGAEIKGNALQQEKVLPSVQLPISLDIAIRDRETGTLLAGVEVKLTRDPEGKDVVVEGLITGQYGEVHFENLSQDTPYYVWITEAPKGYVVQNRPVEIVTGNADSLDDVENDTLLQNVSCGISRLPVTLNVVKVAEEDPSQVLPGATFQLSYDSEGKQLVDLPQTTGADGTVQFVGLKPDSTYYLWETEAPEGYVQSREPMEIVTKLAEESVSYVFYNQRIEDVVDEILPIPPELLPTPPEELPSGSEEKPDRLPGGQDFDDEEYMPQQRPKPQKKPPKKPIKVPAIPLYPAIPVGDGDIESLKEIPWFPLYGGNPPGKVPIDGEYPNEDPTLVPPSGEEGWVGDPTGGDGSGDEDGGGGRGVKGGHASRSDGSGGTNTIPKTGYESNTPLLGLGLAASCLVGGASLYSYRKRFKLKKEEKDS